MEQLVLTLSIRTHVRASRVTVEHIARQVGAGDFQTYISIFYNFHCIHYVDTIMMHCVGRLLVKIMQNFRKGSNRNHIFISGYSLARVNITTSYCVTKWTTLSYNYTNNYKCIRIRPYHSQHDIVLVDINECSSNPCMHGATCTDAVNSYICGCVAGYTGTHCETGGRWGLPNVYKHIIKHPLRMLMWCIV